jgi:hypothetical protein
MLTLASAVAGSIAPFQPFFNKRENKVRPWSCIAILSTYIDTFPMLLSSSIALADCLLPWYLSYGASTPLTSRIAARRSKNAAVRRYVHGLLIPV